MDDAPPLLKYELVVAWYEFILNREKLYVHLKKLCDDYNGKKLLFCVLRVCGKKSDAIVMLWHKNTTPFLYK